MTVREIVDEVMKGTKLPLSMDDITMAVVAGLKQGVLRATSEDMDDVGLWQEALLKQIDEEAAKWL